MKKEKKTNNATTNGGGHFSDNKLQTWFCVVQETFRSCHNSITYF
jgi:hypothetical protein